MLTSCETKETAKKKKPESYRSNTGSLILLPAKAVCHFCEDRNQTKDGFNATTPIRIDRVLGSRLRGNDGLGGVTVNIENAHWVF